MENGKKIEVEKWQKDPAVRSCERCGPGRVNAVWHEADAEYPAHNETRCSECGMTLMRMEAPQDAG